MQHNVKELMSRSRSVPSEGSQSVMECLCVCVEGIKAAVVSGGEAGVNLQLALFLAQAQKSFL